MIAGPDFIWLHFPKCSGTATEKALRRIFAGRADVQFDPIDQQNVIWHDTIASRRKRQPAFDVGGRRIICGIRRLPHWLLSRVHFEYQRSRGRLAPSRGMLLEGRFHEANGYLSQADSYMKSYTAKPVAAWVRTENLLPDLARAFALDPAVIEANLKVENRTAPYVKSLEFWFTPAELQALYDANPIWRDVEKAVYGAILSL